jgi:hypothetical protein
MKNRTELPSNIKKFLSKFPNDTTSWKSATDEIRDIAKDIRELYNEYNENDKIEALKFRSFTKPSEWNTNAKEYIIDTFKKMDAKVQDLFIKDFEKKWLMKECFVKSFEDFKLNEKKEESKEIKIYGSVVVNFEMKSDQITKDEMISYIKNQMKGHLTEEFQTSRCYPDMSTFKIDK